MCFPRPLWRPQVEQTISCPTAIHTIHSSTPGPIQKPLLEWQLTATALQNLPRQCFEGWCNQEPACQDVAQLNNTGMPSGRITLLLFYFFPSIPKFFFHLRLTEQHLNPHSLQQGYEKHYKYFSFESATFKANCILIYTSPLQRIWALTNSL